MRRASRECRKPVCADVIEYYAIESRDKTEEALFAYRKFAKQGITSWIQGITEWHGNAIPKNGIVTDFNTIETLMDKRLDGSFLSRLSSAPKGDPPPNAVNRRRNHGTCWHL